MKRFFLSLSFLTLSAYAHAEADQQSQAQIKPLAAVCNVTQTYKTVQSGPFKVDDSLGGFPSDRMQEFCVAKGSSGYLVTKVKEINHMNWITMNWTDNRIFTFVCLTRVPEAINVCNAITQCRLNNLDAQNIESIEYWHKVYNCN
jgi:hypothetical protein